ncbi:MAG: hypothetical protein ACT4PT_07735 [Methanobacteriota archaeon]
MSEIQVQADLLNHLLWHKAMAEEASTVDRISGYIRMLETRNEGSHVSMTDPFDRSIALTFECCLENQLDPWNIDLARFAEVYAKKIRESPEVDLITAGRIVLLAWTVLKLQSDAIVVKATPPPPAPEGAAWDDLPSAPWLTDDGAYAYTQTVLGGETPIDEKVRHQGDRKVTLFELVQALEEAKHEAEARALLSDKREADRLAYKEWKKTAFQGKLHKEDLEGEIREVWRRIKMHNGDPIPLTMLHDSTKDDLLQAIVGVLFLAAGSRIKVWQEEFPFGDIYVQNIAPHADGPLIDPKLLPSKTPEAEAGKKPKQAKLPNDKTEKETGP